MRPLTKDELDSILGGQCAADCNTTTMDTVVVVGTRILEENGYYIAGTDEFTLDESWAGCSWCSSYYKAFYGALPSSKVPSLPRLQCLANILADHKWQAEFELVILNSYALFSPGTNISTAGMINSKYSTFNPSYPQYTQQLAGWTVVLTQGGHTYSYTYLYAGGMDAVTTSVSWENPVTHETGTFSGTFTGTEWQAFILAHEIQHQMYMVSGSPLNGEAFANYWGKLAVEAVRAGKASGCPS